MTKTIKARVKELLDSDFNAEEAKSYLKIIRSNFAYAEEATSRQVRMLYFLMAFFILLSQAVVSEASFSGLKISDLALIQKTIPALIAFVYYSLIALHTRRRLLLEVHDEILRTRVSKVVDLDLEYYLHPHSLEDTENLIANSIGGSFETINMAFTAPYLLMTYFGVPLFLLYAYYVSFSTFGIGDVVLWVTAIFSAAMIVQCVVFIIGIDKLTGSTSEKDV